MRAEQLGGNGILTSSKSRETVNSRLPQTVENPLLSYENGGFILKTRLKKHRDTHKNRI